MADKGCFQFTTFEFGAHCCACGRYSKAHDCEGKFYCENCCPACQPMKDKPKPVDVTGGQKRLFGE